ncbi:MULTISPECIES: lysylphosphatidylglycerol synthase transmembrane domain-containing protein [Actinomycetospora]|uniref:lysylphosphatidylglycerol synthase transmembrane domain-containing protein n=1 Tax=Actinomycetospora TaxID=402649 RepID=UPI001E37C74F|nr:lysylphosphatidylglycerol synthase domain-containing protein [Actinomycetospora soli]MCD2188083.1 flippase-like domain-containing protein [Actinomycetospora soli]
MKVVKLLVGALLVGAVVVHLGTGPVLDGLRAVSVEAVVAALGLGLVTTAASAARWCLVARGVGLRLGFGRALADCYRAQFLNSVLPAGVLGDVHRAVDHGRRNADVARGVRAVVIERVAGQVVVIAACAALLLVLPGPVRDVVDPAAVLGVLAVVAAVALGVVPALRRRSSVVVPAQRTGSADGSRAHGALAALGRDLRAGLFARRTGPGVVVLSLVATAGHLALLAVAAGPVAPLGVLLPLLALALLSMGLPVNVGGWGPREAVTAAAFGAAGLGAATGLTAAVTYGVLALVSCAPGLGVLLLGRTALARPVQREATGTRNSTRLTFRTRPASVA